MTLSLLNSRGFGPFNFLYNMKVWEALQILEQMDRTKEVTLVFDGNFTKTTKPNPVVPTQPFMPQPVWQQPHYWYTTNTTQ